MFKKLTPSLIRAIIVFFSILVISIALLTASYMYMDDAEQQKNAASRDARKWQSKINSSVENNQIIEQFESNFLKLVNQGVVGAENRLSWFETIQQTAKSRGMPSVKYSISTQDLLDDRSLGKEFRGIDVFKSVMTLDIKMAHEGDLFAILNELNRADGLYAVDKCDIEKLSSLKSDQQYNMKAFCELGWYTFKGSNVGKNNASKKRQRRNNRGS